MLVVTNAKSNNDKKNIKISLVLEMDYGASQWPGTRYHFHHHKWRQRRIKFYNSQQGCSTNEVFGAKSVSLAISLIKTVGLVSRGAKWWYRWESRDSRCSTEGDSYWYLGSQVFVVVSLADLLWIKRSIISLRAEIWACKGFKTRLNPFID